MQKTNQNTSVVHNLQTTARNLHFFLLYIKDTFSPLDAWFVSLCKFIFYMFVYTGRLWGGRFWGCHNNHLHLIQIIGWLTFGVLVQKISKQVFELRSTNTFGGDNNGDISKGGYRYIFHSFIRPIGETGRSELNIMTNWSNEGIKCLRYPPLKCKVNHESQHCCFNIRHCDRARQMALHQAGYAQKIILNFKL